MRIIQTEMPNKLMSKLRHVIFFFVSVIAVAAFQFIGLIWSFADFHPGGDVPFDAGLRHTADIGQAMSAPFMIPLLALMRLTGGHTPLVVLFQWLVLPVAYGFCVYLLILGTIRVTRSMLSAQKPPSQSQ